MFPIKVELVKPHTYNLVEWMLGNTCNYDCSFCHIDSKSGDKKYLDMYREGLIFLVSTTYHTKHSPISYCKKCNESFDIKLKCRF